MLIHFIVLFDILCYEIWPKSLQHIGMSIQRGLRSKFVSYLSNYQHVFRENERKK